jgi:hypothetical protein
MIINQYIVGTGGTELDDDYNGKYNPNFETEGPSKDIINNAEYITEDDSDYRIEYNLLEHWYDFGYVVLDIDDNSIDVKPMKLRIMSSSVKKRKSKKMRGKTKTRGKTRGKKSKRKNKNTRKKIKASK